MTEFGSSAEIDPVEDSRRRGLEASSPPQRAAKAVLEAQNRARLEEDLAQGRLVFESLPRVVEIQLSNFCNMSCIMCYDGVNPPLERIPEDRVRAIADKILPTASVFIPFATSEPLITTWKLTRELAERHGVELEITTNAQFLDLKKAEEMEPHVSRVIFSIDSHIAEVFEAIRLKGRSKNVFDNIGPAARYFRARGIEVVANVVFMMENAPYLVETVSWLADQGVELVHIQKLFYNKPSASFSDAVRHLSPAFVNDLKERIRATARDKGIEVIFDFDGNEVVDHRAADREVRPSRTHDTWLEKLRRFHPGYCPQSVYRLKIDARGNAYPCCVGDQERLKIGNVETQDVLEVWNGPENQDLRRAMLTGDLPATCERCNFRTGPILGLQKQRPFGDEHFVWLESHPERWLVELLGPDHLERAEEPPEFRWGPAPGPIDYWELVFSAGGEEVSQVVRIPADQTSFRPPREVWLAAPGNTAFWWSIWGIVDFDRRLSWRGQDIRAIFRHQPIPRIAESTLRYDIELGI